MRKRYLKLNCNYLHFCWINEFCKFTGGPRKVLVELHARAISFSLYTLISNVCVSLSSCVYYPSVFKMSVSKWVSFWLFDMALTKNGSQAGTTFVKNFTLSFNPPFTKYTPTLSIYLFLLLSHTHTHTHTHAIINLLPVRLWKRQFNM